MLTLKASIHLQLLLTLKASIHLQLLPHGAQHLQATLQLHTLPQLVDLIPQPPPPVGSYMVTLILIIMGTLLPPSINM